MGFLNAFRGKGSNDAMRQTTSLTMAYLLEQNTCFEAYMRQKVEELEARVAAQQARVSVVEVAPPAEADEGPYLAADVAEEETLAGPADTFVNFDTIGADFALVDDEAAPEAEESDLAGNQPAAATAPAVVTPPFTTDEWGSWEEALLGGKPDETAAEESPASASAPEVETTALVEADPPGQAVITSSPGEPAQQTTDQPAEVEEDEAWQAPPETAGPVENWA